MVEMMPIRGKPCEIVKDGSELSRMDAKEIIVGTCRDMFVLAGTGVYIR